MSIRKSLVILLGLGLVSNSIAQDRSPAVDDDLSTLLDDLPSDTGAVNTKSKTDNDGVVTSGDASSTGCSKPSSMPLEILHGFLVKGGRVSVEAKPGDMKSTIDVFAGPIKGSKCFTKHINPVISIGKVNDKDAYQLEFKYVESEAALISCIKDEASKAKEKCDEDASCLRTELGYEDMKYSIEVPKDKEISSNVYFKSTGRIPMPSAKYKKVAEIQPCSFVESAASSDVAYLTLFDQKKKIVDCPSCDTKKDEILKEILTTDMSDEMRKIAEAIFLDKLKKWKDGGYKDTDPELLKDFKVYILDHLKVKIAAAYAAGDKEEMKKLTDKLKEYEKIFSGVKVSDYEGKGEFDAAREINSIKLSVSAYTKLGKKDYSSGKEIVFTPEYADKMINEAVRVFEEALPDKIEEYAVKTGQVTGKAEMYKNMRDKFKAQGEARYKSYKQAMQLIYDSMADCQKKVLQQLITKCQQDKKTQIEKLYKELKDKNNKDLDKYNEYNALYIKWQNLENEGAISQGKEPTEVELDEDVLKSVEDQLKTSGSTVPNVNTGNPNYNYNNNAGYNQNQYMPQQNYNNQSLYSNYADPSSLYSNSYNFGNAPMVPNSSSYNPYMMQGNPQQFMYPQMYNFGNSYNPWSMYNR